MSPEEIAKYIEANKAEMQPKLLQCKAPLGMRKFTITRINDQSGVSGTGVVIQGVEFSSGHLAMHWLTPFPYGDLMIKQSWDSFLNIHVHPHPTNITVICFEDGEVRVYPQSADTKHIRT